MRRSGVPGNALRAQTSPWVAQNRCSGLRRAFGRVGSGCRSIMDAPRPLGCHRSLLSVLILRAAVALASTRPLPPPDAPWSRSREAGAEVARWRQAKGLSAQDAEGDGRHSPTLYLWDKR
jgi:hypothetical protein